MKPMPMLIAVSVFFLWTGAAVPSARGQQRKVFTNDDFPQAAAPAPASAAPATAPSAAPPASPGSPPQPALTGPHAEYQNALSFQQALRQNLQEIQAKLASETNEARRSRWTAMVECLETLIERNQETINDLSREMQIGSGPGPEGS
ncbi:MAG TPA: hypothetical protein VNN17_00925 [Terriglobia bacterium]|nr:hypothetical protein [Terriglobia bacterium]